MARRDDNDSSQKLKVRAHSAETNTTAIVEIHLQGLFFFQDKNGEVLQSCGSIYLNVFSFLLFQVTIYCQGFRLPFTLPLGPSPDYKTRDITAWNLFPEIASQIAQEDQCKCYLYVCLMNKQSV